MSKICHLEELLLENLETDTLDDIGNIGWISVTKKKQKLAMLLISTTSPTTMSRMSHI